MLRGETGEQQLWLRYELLSSHKLLYLFSVFLAKYKEMRGVSIFSTVLYR